MKYQGLIGVGCYGKPETLSRVLKRMVARYISGNFREPGRVDSRQCVQFETFKLFKTLMGGLLESHQFPEPEIIENIKRAGVTGFFLALERRGLNLSIFTRDGQATDTVNLDGQAEIRKTHLH